MKEDKLKSIRSIKRMQTIYVLAFLFVLVCQQILLFLSTWDDTLSLMGNIMKTADTKILYIDITIAVVSIIILILINYFVKKMIRNIEHYNEQLVKYAEHAEEANASKSLFLANMSHEIRTPLNAIIGFSDILSISDLSATEKEYAGIIARSAKSLLAVINDILDISKIESEVFDISSEPFEIEPFLEQVIELYSAKADEKKIQLSYYFDNSIPTLVNGDSFRIQQVLSNLLSNAIKFTPQKGHVSFKALLIRKDHKNATVRFAVKDNGIGMSKEGQRKIFEPFTQADGSITRKYGGTGLGLSISRKIVNAMGSEMELFSEENKGSLFSFDLEFSYEKGEEKMNRFNDQLVFGLFPNIPNDIEMKKRLMDVLSAYGHIIENATERYFSEINYLFALDVDNVYLEARRAKSMYTGIPIIFANIDRKLMSEESRIFYEIIREPFYKSKMNKVIERLRGSQDIEEIQEDDEVFFEGNVLVAEDNTTNQILMRILLEQLGTTVFFADNGEEAVEKFKNEQVDIILMDVHMPVMDGITAMNSIRRYNKGKEIPIIALTADAVAGDREKYIQMGMDGYLSKPVNFEEIVLILKKHLKMTSKRLIKPDDKQKQVVDIDIDQSVLAKEKSSLEELKPVINPIQSEKNQITHVSNVEIKYRGDDSLSFKERVALANQRNIVNPNIPKLKEVRPERQKKRKIVDLSRHQQKDADILRIETMSYDKVLACSRIGIDEITLDMLLDNFNLTYEKDLDKLRQALDSKDPEEIRQAAHYIKGSASNLRIQALVDVMDMIGKEVKEGRIPNVDISGIKQYLFEILN